MRTIGSGRMYPDFFTENDALKGHGEGVREPGGRELPHAGHLPLSLRSEQAIRTASDDREEIASMILVL